MLRVVRRLRTVQAEKTVRTLAPVHTLSSGDPQPTKTLFMKPGLEIYFNVQKVNYECHNRSYDPFFHVPRVGYFCGMNENLDFR